MGFFSINVTDDYVENNYVYAEEYKRVLNKNIKYGNGYVSLSRILEFYIECVERTKYLVMKKWHHWCHN